MRAKEFCAVFAAAAFFLAGRAAAGEAEAAPAPAPKPKLGLPIVEVVVYEDRALVTREGEVPVAGKVETVFVGGLPPTLVETSIRAGLAGDVQGRVISVSSEVEREREIQDAQLKALDEKRRALGREIAALKDDLARIEAREAYLNAFEGLAKKAISERTGLEGDPELVQWSQALRFIREQRAESQTQKLTLDRKLKDLDREDGDLRAEAERLRKPAERSTRTAEVALETAAAGKARLRLSYVIEGAGWSPRYDARFDPEKKEIAVTYFGEVRQKTGEDWKDAKLVLSTARPSVGASRPQLLPLRLAAVAVQKGKRPEIAHLAERAAEAEDLGALAAGAAPEGAGGTGFLVADVEQGATSATFSVPGAATVPADGRPHKVPITTFRERAGTGFETVPRLERFVYLKCSARNGSPFPLLAGPADIFRGSGFIGTSSLKFVAPGSPFDVSLGIEESLKVRRAATFDGWTGRGKEKRHGYDIEVANFGEKAQTVTVIENYPVSDLEEVTVRLESSTTAPSEKNEKEGILRWKLEVPAGEARTVHVEYTINYPKDYAGP